MCSLTFFNCFNYSRNLSAYLVIHDISGSGSPTALQGSLTFSCHDATSSREKLMIFAGAENCQIIIDRYRKIRLSIIFDEGRKRHLH